MVVSDLVARERGMLHRFFDRSSDVATLQEEAEYEFSDIWPITYGLLPVGTIACVGALNAAGCATVWSNNGLSSDRYAMHAHVSFFANVDRVELLATLATRASVRLNGGVDQLELVPQSADGLFHFAEEMLEASDEWVASRPLDPDERGMPDPLELAGLRGTKH